ncbi:SAM-dependent methyltransferase [Methylacidiphilum infernorum V4]|uniref:SAM-dependent methyltransferase n=1 Tax=Methylacidiphilum infernorum (isolate V4) TaxID=481448 RepID=B3DZJ5_METI4|nr:SAM-dependent methyltransferase [Methylacidiphilum infernorum V4]
MKEVCKGYENKLETICSDVFEFLERDLNQRFDLVCAVGFLHHIKDYLALIQKAVSLIKPKGYFFSFEDPLYHKTLDFYSFFLSQCLYYSWRITQGDILGGLYRKMRRVLIGYKDDVYDNTEYHAIRSGVDQESIINLLKNHGFSCSIGYYFSNQSPLLQSLGKKLKIKNYFYIIGKRL